MVRIKNILEAIDAINIRFITEYDWCYTPPLITAQWALQIT